MLGNIRRKTKLNLFLFLFLSCFIFVPLAVAGDGGGSGGGKDEPLSLLSSYPANGSTGISRPVEINLGFNKNVVYMEVRENNRNCVALYSSTGSRIPAEVVMADDQIEFEKRREIRIRPLQELKPGGTYIVQIASGLQSKSGATLGRQVEISFTTAGSGAGDKKNIDQANFGSTEQKTPLPLSEEKISQAETKDQNSSGSDSNTSGKPTPAGQDSPVKNNQITVTIDSDQMEGPESSKENNGSERGKEIALTSGGILAMSIIGYSYYRHRK